MVIGFKNENPESDIRKYVERLTEPKEQVTANSYLDIFLAERGQAPVSALPYHFLSPPGLIIFCFLLTGAGIKGMCHTVCPLWLTSD